MAFIVRYLLPMIPAQLILCLAHQLPSNLGTGYHQWQGSFYQSHLALIFGTVAVVFFLCPKTKTRLGLQVNRTGLSDRIVGQW